MRVQGNFLLPQIIVVITRPSTRRHSTAVQNVIVISEMYQIYVLISAANMELSLVESQKRFTRREHKPYGVKWLAMVSSVGNALMIAVHVIRTRKNS